MDEKKEVDDISGVETTGHEWNGIKELDNPLPRWWLWTFYATVVWAAIYTIAFPAWPLISQATGGVLGYSSREQVMEEIAAHRETQSVYVDRIADMDLAQIAADPELMQFAQAGGAAIFRTYCSQCHGAGAQGAVGYPNLNDDAWLWGGLPEEIYHTIAHGVRWEADPETRYSMMPQFGVDGLLEREQIRQVVEYVHSFTHQDVDAELAAQGETVFAENCVACHGENAKGNKDLGAPNLTDPIWLYGGDRDTLTTTVYYSRFGQMPAWIARLPDASVKQVALYVHSLGGGVTPE